MYSIYVHVLYIYALKGQKRVSKLFWQACTEARKGNPNTKQQVRDIGRKFLNNVEISAEEAVFIELQLPTRKASREIILTLHTLMRGWSL